MTQFFAQFARNNDEVDRGANPEAVYERLCKMNHEDFGGTTDPMAAERWIKSIEAIFTFMELLDADRVRCDTYLLKDDARLLWEGASVLTREFMALRQGDRSVEEFVRKFEQGCHFVPLIANEVREKLRHFMDGLRPILCRDFRIAGPPTYPVVVTRALVAEQEQKDIEI
ncbi:uncharacterized protein LOC142506915 [Primulina tabacum]|uniref:uncharacterized protein LOC142506915 n=1 Tax=Primulina tabacum TaxID=48773 RepID=UPI003F59D8AF